MNKEKLTKFSLVLLSLLFANIPNFYITYNLIIVNIHDNANLLKVLYSGVGYILIGFSLYSFLGSFVLLPINLLINYLIINYFKSTITSFRKSAILSTAVFILNFLLPLVLWMIIVIFIFLSRTISGSN